MNLLLWLWRAQLRAQPVRVATAVAAIAIGVALGLAIHLINHSALAEFGRALSVVNGDAHLQVTGAGQPLDESWYPRIAREPGVADASPLIDIEVPVLGQEGDSAPAGTIRLIGLDVFRAARVSPGLLPIPDGATGGGSQSPLFADDTVFLSAAATARFGLATGERLRLRSGLAVVELRVAGGVPGASGGQALAVMDIGALQWRFGWTGRLSRIDLRLADGIAPAAFAEAAQRRYAGQLLFTLPDTARQRMSNLSRAYRVNLDVLSLVALFTGVFIVHGSLALMVARQRPQLALIGVLGASRRRLAALVAGQGLLLGLAGATIGVGAGVLIAAAALRTRGGDLGGGYFGGLHPALTLEPATLAGYLLVGVFAGLAGSLWPALGTRALPLARALKSTLPPVRQRRQIVTPLLLLATGAALLQLPAWRELPVAAYAAIGCWLLGGIAAVPWGLAALGALLDRASDLLWRRPPLWLGSRRIVAASDTGDAAALAAVVASFALATAMAVMVGSFRDSVDRWLGTVLPADLYLRAGSDGAGGGLNAALQQRLQAVPGLARVEFMRTRSINLEAARPPVVLIARPLDPHDPARHLPVTGAVLPAAAGLPAIYVSEAMVDLYRLTPGRTTTLTVDGRTLQVFVRAVWRDYARQHGAVVLAEQDYRRLTGDASANEVALWLAAGTDAAQLRAALVQAAPELAAAEVREAGEIRRLSLRIFDRSFAVTWLLEVIAMLVGLFGVTATFAGEAVARVREFGMLRHLGVSPLAVAAQLACEALLRLATGAAGGLALGLLIGWVLIHRVNPQSFHWTMDMRIPLAVLAASFVVLLLVGTTAAVLAARQAMGVAPVRAVREDW